MDESTLAQNQPKRLESSDGDRRPDLAQAPAAPVPHPGGGGTLTENLDLLNTAVSLLIRAALLAARFSGRVRRRSLKRLAAKDTDAKAREILFLKDRV